MNAVRLRGQLAAPRRAVSVLHMGLRLGPLPLVHFQIAVLEVRISQRETLGNKEHRMQNNRISCSLKRTLGLGTFRASGGNTHTTHVRLYTKMTLPKLKLVTATSNWITSCN